MFVASLPLALLSALAVWDTADPTWRIPGIVAIVVIHLSLLLRGWVPWMPMLFTALGTLALLGSPAVSPTVSGLPGYLPAILLPSTAMFGVAIYSVAAHARTNRWLALVFGGAGAAELVAALWHGIPWLLTPATMDGWRLGVGLVATLLALLAYACGRWRALAAGPRPVATRWDDTTDHVSDHLEVAVTRQQTRMAREVQRAVADNLDEILSRAREGRVAYRRAPALADDALSDITAQGEEALGRVQSLLSLIDAPDPEEFLAELEESRPVLAAEHALSPMPQLDDFPRLIDAARGEGLAVTLSVEGVRGNLPAAGQLALYRTAQEALTNTVRHAGPGAVAQVEILWETDEVSVTIEDENPGRDLERDLEAKMFEDPEYVEGRGLRVVGERLESAGGYLEVDQLDGGYRVRGAVPRAQPSEMG